MDNTLDGCEATNPIRARIAATLRELHIIRLKGLICPGAKLNDYVRTRATTILESEGITWPAP